MYLQRSLESKEAREGRKGNWRRGVDRSGTCRPNRITLTMVLLLPLLTLLVVSGYGFASSVEPSTRALSSREKRRSLRRLSPQQRSTTSVPRVEANTVSVRKSIACDSLPIVDIAHEGRDGQGVESQAGIPWAATSWTISTNSSQQCRRGSLNRTLHIRRARVETMTLACHGHRGSDVVCDSLVKDGEYEPILGRILVDAMNLLFSSTLDRLVTTFNVTSSAPDSSRLTKNKLHSLFGRGKYTLFVDIGANVGAMAFPMYRRGANVVAVDAMEVNTALLQLSRDCLNSRLAQLSSADGVEMDVLWSAIGVEQGCACVGKSDDPLKLCRVLSSEFNEGDGEIQCDCDGVSSATTTTASHEGSTKRIGFSHCSQVIANRLAEFGLNQSGGAPQGPVNQGVADGSGKEFFHCASGWRRWTSETHKGVRSAGKLQHRGFTPVQSADELLLPLIRNRSEVLRSHIAKRLDKASNLLPFPTVILKVDVEGSEWSALRSARGLLRDPTVRPALILTELWQRLPSGMVADLASSLMDEADYVACVVDLSEGEWLRVRETVRATVRLNTVRAVEGDSFLVTKLTHLNHVFVTPVEVLAWHMNMNGEAGNVAWIRRDILPSL